jgi:predicted Zn-dependent protease
MSPLRTVAVATLLTATTNVLSGCAVNPVTGDRELALVSEDQEIAMGRNAAQEVRATIGFVDDDALQEYVARIGAELASTSERPSLPWSFHVVDDPVPNAFALPGGYVFVTRGLMALMNSEAELAAVLGHEIGHVTARHSVSQVSKAQLAQLGLGIGIIASPELFEQFGDLANSGLALLFLKYGRDDERQADELGFRYMLAHDYDVREMEKVFASLQASSRLAGASPMPSWLATHPSEPERIAAVRERIAALDMPPQSAKTNANAYMSAIDGLVYGEDPRHGFFADDMFHHPELGFEFMVPEQWRRQNMASMVVGISPDQDAAVQLTLVPGTPDEAATSFLTSDAVAEIESSRTKIHGFDAVVTRFQVTTANGALAGIAAHIDAGSGSYRLIAYAPQPALAARAQLLSQIVGSFAPVSEQAIADAQARRVSVVAIERDMTLDEFASRYPSKVPIEELAVLNQIGDSQDALSRGTEAKRII